MLPLLDPPGWDSIPEQVRIELKCGPGNGFAEGLVPDTWRFGCPFYKPLVVTPACQRHDAEYRWLAPPSRIGKEQADIRFFNNLCRLVHNAGGPRWLLRYRYMLATKYYHAVRDGGGSSFWDHKVSAVKRDNWERKLDGLS